MKKVLFAIIVILLTPIYLIIQFTIGIMELIADLTEPFADGMIELVENMTAFWKENLTKEGGIQMSIQRKMERNNLKKKWKEHNEGVEKRYRTSFSSYWKAWNNYKKNRGGK